MNFSPEIPTSLKINMEPKKGGLENYFTVQLGDFLVPAVHFQGCNILEPKKDDGPGRCFCFFQGTIFRF